jgi:transposase
MMLVDEDRAGSIAASFFVRPEKACLSHPGGTGLPSGGSLSEKVMDTGEVVSKLRGMGKTYRFYDLNQRLLLPPDLREWLREDHLALYVSDLVDQMDLREIMSEYEEGDLRGRPPYHPAMMVKLLIYGYCVGKMSSRKIEESTYDDVAFRVLACNQQPDHDSIAAFRKRHLKELGKLFVQVVELCQRAGLVKLGYVALDGTKIKANASKRRSMSYQELIKGEKELEAKIKELLQEAERIDEEEDKMYGKGKRGNELPEEMRKRETRLAKIRELKAELEREAKEAADKELEVAEEQKAAKERGERVVKSYRRRKWTRDESGEIAPRAKTQRNLTDPDSRIMKNVITGSFEQAFNAQIAVDREAKIIVANRVVQQTNDQEQLVPGLKEVEKNVGRMPEQASADAGYFSTSAVTDESLKEIDLYVPPNGRGPQNGKAVSEQAVVREKMWQKLRTPSGAETYKKRNTTVELVFAEIKHVRKFRQFAMRGLKNVEAEWSLICLTHNVLKLFRARKQLKFA